MNATVPAVDFAAVDFERGERSILGRVTFAVEPGEFVGIIGGNGAGKSTLLQLTMGLLAPSRGEIRVFGAPPRATHGTIGYVPQRIELDPDVPLRARDFVALGVDGAKFGIPFPSARRRSLVDAALADVGASSLDEPLANLDLSAAAGIVETTARIARERGITVLLVAHDVNPLVRYMDRVLYLANGRAAIGTVDAIVNEDTLSRLYDRPVDVLRVRGRIIVVAGDA